MRWIEFEGGDRMPALGLGTWKSEPGEVGAAVKEAVKLGYRHFDCAWVYQNQSEIGAALRACIRDGLVTRDELWITSKLWNDRHAEDDVVPALEETLAELGLEHLDLYLVHWPVALKKGKPFPDGPDDFVPLEELPLAATWAGMERAADRGLTRHIGVSNCSVPKLEGLIESGRRRPEANQVEMHPFLQQQALVDFCRAERIAVTGYSPLGSLDRPARLKAKDEPDLLGDPVLGAVAARHGATPAQVALAWAVQRGTSVIPKSVNPGRLAENLAAADLELTDADMAAIAALDIPRRYITGAFWAVEGGPYTVAGLWDE